VSKIAYEANVCLTLALLALHKKKDGQVRRRGGCGTFVFDWWQKKIKKE
jgi:hypothetical protein